MKYIRVMMLALLTLCGNRVVGQTFEDVQATQNREYSIKIENSPSSSLIAIAETNSGGDLYTQLLTDLGKSEAELQSGLYFRWYLIDRQGNYVTNSSSPFTQYAQYAGYSHKWTTNGDMYWCSRISDAVNGSGGTTGWENNLADNNGNKPKVLNAYYTPSGTGDSKWYDYQVVFVATSDLTNIALENNYVTTEPTNFQVKYVFTFDDGYVPVIVDNFLNVPSDIYTNKKEITIYEALSPASASITLNDATAPSYIRWYFADANGNAVPNPGFTLSNEGYTYTSQGNSIYYGGTSTDTNAELLNMTVTPQDGMSWSDLTSYKLVALLSNEVGTTDENGTLTQEPLIATKYEISFDYVTFASALPSSQRTLNIEVTNAEAQTATISLSEQWEQIKSDLGAETVTYVKYYWLDGNNSIVQTGSLTGGISFSEHSLAGMHWLKPADTSFGTDMLNFTASVTSGVITDYKLVILFSDEAATYSGTDWVKEPTLQSMYTVSFSVISFENTVSATEYKTIDIYEEQTYENISVDLGGTAPTYVRWCWLSDGNSVTSTDWTFANADVTFTDYNGTKYHYAGTTANEELNKLTITPPAGTDAKTLPSTNLKLVALVSTKTADDGAILDASSNLIKEPLIDTKYIISFETVGFEGSTAGAQSLSETIRLADDAMSSVTLSLPLSSVQDYMNKEESSFYIRYYLTDKTGNRIALPDGVTITPTDNSIALTSNTYGHYWYSSTGIGDVTDLGVTVADANGTTDLRNYNVVAVMSSNPPLQVEADGTVTYEPREMEVVYTYKLVSATKDPFLTTDTQYEVRHRYILYDPTTRKATVDFYTDEFSGASSYFNKTNEDFLANYYLRWALEDDAGNLMEIDNTVIVPSKSGTYANTAATLYMCSYWASFLYQANQGQLEMTLTLPEDLSYDDYNLSILLTDDLTGANKVTDEWENVQQRLDNEPTDIKLKYVYHLVTAEDIAQMEFASTTTASKTYNELVRIASSSETAYTIPLYTLYTNTIQKEVFGGTAPTNAYFRWYIADAKGNPIEELTTTETGGLASTGQFAHTSVGADGLIWMSKTATYEFDANHLNIKYTKGTDAYWGQYKVVCLITDELEGMQYVNGTYLADPETIKAKVIYSFTDGIDRFSGTAATDAIEKSFRRELEEDENGVYDKTAQLNLSEDMSAEYKATLTGAETVYLRWYVTDKSGNIFSPDASPVSLALSENDKLHQTEYGYIWYSGYDGEGTFSTDLLNVTATASANVNLYDYNVVCVMTTDVSDATMEGGEFVKESSWEARYTYTFTRAFAGELADDAKTIYKTLVVADDATSVNVPLSKRLVEIASFFGGSIADLNTNFHIRWALLDTDGNEVYTQGQLTNNNYNENDYGIYWNTKANKNSNTFYNDLLSVWIDATYTLLDGAAWNDYKLVIYMTDDNEETDGVRTETYIENSTEKTRLVHEPNHLELRYIIDFQTVSEVQSRFVHYKGYANSDFTSVAGSPTTNNVAFNAQTGEYETVSKDIRQQTHEWTYEIYIKPGASKELVLPILNGDPMEPQAYFRWYDWNTDQGSSTVSEKSESLLSSIYSENRGLFGICLGGAPISISNTTGTAPTNVNVGVTFTAPSAEWNEPIVIACDISKYGDGMDLSETYLVHEPTLSYRYKYIIRPARMIADAIKEGVNDPNDNLLENHGDVTIGISGTDSKASLRLNLSNVDNYYFYPYTLSFDDSGNRVESWSNELVQATKVSWRVYDASGLYYMDMGNNLVLDNGLFFVLSQTNINGTYRYKYAPTDYTLNKDIQFNIGDPFYVFAYASDGTNSCPIARFNCRFSENYPIAADDVVANTEYRTRTVNYLDQHYSRVGLISFDVEEGGTLSLPTFPLDNMNPMPFKWSRSHYGYCYPGLYPYLVGNAQRYYGLSPIHGDYTLIKSMNLDGVSEDKSGDGYLKYWWKSDKTLRDLTYRYSAGDQNGYFIYVDASEESRPIANVAFEGEMCVGSTLVLSAMVADMTSGNEKPQLIFKLYGIKTDVDGNETERKLVHSFATCDFSTVGASDYGVWYQVYAKVTLQNNSGADQYRQFIVSIDNYCASTDGADYAIDDIRIYAQNSKVEVKQNSVLCSGTGQGTKADIMIPHETLLAMMPTTDAAVYPLPVYYRICTENGEVVKGIYGDGAAEEYGQVDFRYYFYDAASSDANESKVGEGETTEWLSHHYRKDAEGKRYFVVNEADQEFALKEGQKYYVSLAVPKYNAEDEIYELDDYTWGSPQDPCSMYSDVFQPLSQSLNLMVGTNGINRINVDCHLTKTSDDFSITGALQLPDSETGELVSIDNPALCSFDWIVENVDDATIFTDALRSALVSFRNEYGELQDADGNPQQTTEGNIIYHTALPEPRPADDAEGFNGKEYDLLKAAIDAGKLYIVGSSTLQGPVYKVGNTYRIIAVPLEEQIIYNGTRYEVCPEPMEVTVEARLNGPELDLGFKEVDYEGVGLTYGANGLRVGLKQLEKMQQEEIPLHLPISKYKQLQVVDGKEEYVEYDTYDLILDEFDVIVWDSNDPTWASYLCKEKDLYGSEVEIYCLGGEKSHEISNKNQSVELLLHPNFTKKKLVSGQETVGDEVYEGHKVEHTETSDKIEYHEGYWYKVKFRYSTREDAEGNPILGRCYGESYITIKVVPEYATWGEGLPNNSNWLNDENWRRSSKAELYKEVVNSNDYPVYDESTGLSNDKGFVPMSFTYVTILGGMPTPYPYLSQLQTNKFTGLITEETLTNGDLSPATTLIQYDMMVTDKPGVCLYDASKTNVYECERFYGNVCKDIYFKPRAQLRNQHYLTYTKAWVDVELLPGQWTMLAAPLMKVHAGNFYVPTVEGTLYGRQETEAFQPIEFDAALNSRNAYPFYQRSWDKKVSKVVTTPDDIRGESDTEGEHWYDAFVSYNPWTKGNVKVECLQWSHAYNDMQEHYEPGKGFSIKAHHKDDAPTPLIRLPKADDAYTYYNYKDEANPEYEVKIDTISQHRLAVDGVVTGMLAVPLTSNETEANGYYLVGNPYMARLDMELFFSYNPQLVKTYWVVTGNEVDYRPKEGSTSLGIIGPMQSFFVKVAEGKSVSQVVFSPDMQASNMKQDVATVTDETVTTRLTFATRATSNAPMASSTRVILSAETDNGFVDEEDVETLLDSNLEDVPMVYTVAGTQAAMVNRLNDLTLLPLGVFGKEGETVDVQVSGVDGFSQMLYFYDASTGRQTLLEEGTELTLAVGEHGRYFITARAIGDPAEDKAKGGTVRAYSLEQGRLVVAAMPDDCLHRVQVYATNGTLVTDDVPAGSVVAEYALSAGTYVVTVETLNAAGRQQSLKVVVR